MRWQIRNPHDTGDAISIAHTYAGMQHQLESAGTPISPHSHLGIFMPGRPFLAQS